MVQWEINYFNFYLFVKSFGGESQTHSTNSKIFIFKEQFKTNIYQNLEKIKFWVRIKIGI